MITREVLQILEVITTPKSSDKRRRIHTGTGVCVEEKIGMIKAIRPKSNVNIGTNKLATNTFGDNSIGAFHRAKLMTAIRASRTNSKAVALKELSSFNRTIHLSTLIESLGSLTVILCFRLVTPFSRLNKPRMLLMVLP